MVRAAHNALTMCKALLDHNSYPHIIDSIIALSDFTTLLALRGTCKCIHQRVDNVVSTHVSVTHRGARTPDGRRVPTFSPYSSPRPEGVRRVRLLDVHSDPDPNLLNLIEHTTLDFVRIFGECAADYNCDTLLLYSMHSLPSHTRTHTLVLDVPFAPGFTHIVTAPSGSCHTLVAPRDMRIVILGNPASGRITRLSLEEWRTSDRARELHNLEQRSVVN